MDDLVEAVVKADKVDERAMEFHRAADGAVGGELRVGALVAVGVEAAGFVYVVVVRRRAAGVRGCRDDGEGGVGLARFPDALARRRETDAFALELEALGELGGGGDVGAVAVAELAEAGEGGEAEAPVGVEVRRSVERRHSKPCPYSEGGLV